MASAEPSTPQPSLKSPVSAADLVFCSTIQFYISTNAEDLVSCSTIHFYISTDPCVLFYHSLTYISTDPARVVFTPTIQYLPLALSGVIHCHIESHPPFQFITWTKDKRIFDPFDMDEITTLTNGSLLINRVRSTLKPAYDGKLGEKGSDVVRRWSRMVLSGEAAF